MTKVYHSDEASYDQVYIVAESYTALKNFKDAFKHVNLIKKMNVMCLKIRVYL